MSLLDCTFKHLVFMCMYVCVYNISYIVYFELKQSKINMKSSPIIYIFNEPKPISVFLLSNNILLSNGDT